MIEDVKSFFDSKIKLIMILLLFISLQQFALSKDISVCDTGCDFTNITDAINSAEPGDTLQVRSGIYKENVNVSKSLTLLGQDVGSGKPVIDADWNGSALSLFADGVVVEGFNLTNSLGSRVEILAGIEVNSNNNILKNNLAFNNENGILIYGGNNSIQGNNASNNIYGIRAKNTDNNTIIDNTLRNNNYGLFLLNSNNNTIQRNQVINNEFGILINQSIGNNLTQNQMIGNSYNFGSHGDNRVDTTNLADGKPVYYLVGSSNQEINSTSNAATISCINCRNLAIKGLDLKNNFYGIYLENTSHAVIEGNNLSNNRIGLALVNSYYNSLRANHATDNNKGFELRVSRYNTLQSNKALKSQAGLNLVNSDYNRLLGNRLSQNERGLWLYRSGQNLLSENNLSSNALGGEFDLAWLNQLSHNNVSDNDQGILLDQSTNNDLLGNRIFNNHEGILYDPLDNNTLGADNLYWNNTANRTEIRTRTTEGVIKSSIAVVIVSNPKDAVIINGDENAKAPGPVYFVDPGEYNVLIKKQGYKDGILTIDIPEKISPAFQRERSIDLIPEENT
jgi:parallel beta-helix repeat protein